MKIESIKIKGFRCFDDSGQIIFLDDLTCFIGPNASGKTAAMMALARLFGESQAQRQIIPADFHLGQNEELKTKSTRTLLIEYKLIFPELEKESGEIDIAVPETFNQMIVDKPGGTPYCRLRLEATWTDDGTTSGDIEQSLYWILTDSDDQKIIEDGNKRKVLPGDRSKIRVIYVPASRDPDLQIRATTSTNFGRLLGALEWNGEDESLKTVLTSLHEQLAKLAAIKTMNKQVKTTWDDFYDGFVAQDVSFQAIEEDPASLLKNLVPTFMPGEDGKIMLTNALSDGLRSLFSLTLSLGLFRVEKLIREKAGQSGFKEDIIEKLPILTIFAIEEPENHLSPHYLGRIVANLECIAKEENAQVVISSHSPSILERVEPDNVRYFLGNELKRSTKVKRIPLPDDDKNEEFKYVREAVRSFPELYFARLVILGEGASEEIVLKRFFKASVTPLDNHFISIVPLGGRHVNHFWRLLHGLQIPFITLLDLDREKEGAGWGRIQYVRDQLVQRYKKGNEKLNFEEDGKKRSLEEIEYDTLYKKNDADIKDMDSWVEFFEKYYKVFFAKPLDLDFCMLEAFPDIYKTLGNGPRLPAKPSTQYDEAILQRMKQVLAPDASKAPDTLGSYYTKEQHELFPWYKYLFIDGSKPVNHMRALLKIDDSHLIKDAPEVFKRISEEARKILSQSKGAK
jgi:putative ATP-dependent endonuclease of the OLD family